jgi:predicted metal-dependent hydrolase
VTHKSARIAAMVDTFRGRKLAAQYHGYFDCFNRREFYAAHEVLEDLWLLDRRGHNGDFYKGLIQLAGAFVHLQKNRLRPADALFKLAQVNLEKYPSPHEQLDVQAVLRLIARWRQSLAAADFSVNPLTTTHGPQLTLLNLP